jgi:SAM-dependent methyltransferase
VRGSWYGIPLQERERIYARQSLETAALRRYIYGLLPLRRTARIIEPGCGTGLVLSEVSLLTDAALYGYDRDAGALAKAESRIPGLNAVECDIERHPLSRADIVLLSHVLLELEDAPAFMAKLAGLMEPGGRLAVLGEYDWRAAATSRGDRVLEAAVRRMEEDGLDTSIAGGIPGLIAGAGLRLLHFGSIRACSRIDPLFLASLYLNGKPLDETIETPPLEGTMSLPVVWAVAGR